MVRSKEAPKKKPKDPLLTPPSKPRGGGFLAEPGRPWSRGGAAMSPVPSYMRGTSSSDAKAGRRARPVAPVSASASPARRMTVASVPASASPARRRPAVRVLTRGKVLFPEEAPGSGSGSALGRATCSSTMKEAKFPDALDLAPGATDAEGPAALRVCPYTYCSLNGHAHHSPAVPLRSFLASRRRLIKTQQSMKLKGVSAFRKKSGEKSMSGGGSGGGGAKIAPLIDEEAVGDFFVEVYAGPRVSSDMSCSDMSLDEMYSPVRRMEFVVFDQCGADEDSEKGKDLVVCDDGDPEPHLKFQEKHGAIRDSLSECSGADTGSDFVEELPWLRYHGYEYEDSLDDEIAEEQRMREEAGGVEISGEQEEEQGKSGRSAAEDFKEDAAEELENDDVENTSNLACGAEIIADQDVACRLEACQEPDGRDEEQLSEDVYKSEIPDQEVTGGANTILEESCKEETYVDQEGNDDVCSVESDGESEVTQEQDAEDEESTPDDDSEMEISENTISGDGCREDFSEEVTSRAVPEDDSTADYEQYVGTVDDAFEQYVGTPASGHNDAQKEFCITRSKLEVISEETATAQQTYQDGSINDMVPKEMEITTCKLEEAFEESGNPQESNRGGISTCVDDAQVELDITTCKSKDASEESNATEKSGLNDNAENVTDGAEMGPEITKCNLEDASEESGTDEDTAEDDESACYSGDTQNDLQTTKCISLDTSKESAIAQEADQSVIQEDEDGIKTAGGQNKSEITPCESGSASLKPAKSHEADGDINITHASYGLQKDTTMPKLDACEGNTATEEAGLQKLDAYEDIRATEEAVQSSQIPADFADAKEPSIDDICGAFSGMNLKGDVYFDPAESATCPRNKLIISRRRRTPEEEEYLRGFNPRAPNFLPLELDPDAEKVDLKHQMMDERKNAEEWMIDYALRRAVTNLAPARKKKVELLVQAFETVLPHDEDDKKSITPTRPVQACN